MIYMQHCSRVMDYKWRIAYGKVSDTYMYIQWRDFLKKTTTPIDRSRNLWRRVYHMIF